MSEKSGAFKRDTTYLDGRITADGSDGWPLHVEQSERVVSAGYEAIETVRFDRR